MNGSDLLVLVNMGTDADPDFQVIGCQRDSTFEEVSDTIDNSCKSSRAQRVDFGRYSGTISLDFLFVSNRADFILLRDANRNGEKVLIAAQSEDVIIRRALCKIDTMSSTFPDQAESVVSISLSIDEFVLDAWVIGVGILGSVFITYV